MFQPRQTFFFPMLHNLEKQFWALVVRAPTVGFRSEQQSGNSSMMGLDDRAPDQVSAVGGRAAARIR